jgi:hypothetical protein
MRRDEENEKELGIFIEMPAEKSRQDDAVAETRYGKKLSESLQRPDYNCLKIGKHTINLKRYSTITDIFLLKNSATPARPVGLRPCEALAPNQNCGFPNALLTLQRPDYYCLKIGEHIDEFTPKEARAP